MSWRLDENGWVTQSAVFVGSFAARDEPARRLTVGPFSTSNRTSVLRLLVGFR